MKKKILSFIFALALLILPKEVYAAGSATIGFEGKNSVSVGDTVTVSMYVSNVSGTVDDLGVVSVGGELVFDSSYLQYVSFSPASGTYSFDMNEDAFIIAGVDSTLKKGIKSKTTVMTITFKALKEGSVTINLNKSKTTDPDGKLTTTVSPLTITIGPAREVKDVTLSSLSVSGYSISPAFSKNTTSYTLTVPNATDSITIAATATDSTATVTGTGNKNLQVGTNNFTIKVTATDNTSKSYTLKVTRQSATSAASSDNKLKSLSVSGHSISPSFSSSVTEYTLNVGKDVNSITINGEKNDSKATVTGLGSHNLVPGNNRIEVVVTSESGTPKTYVINVNKEKDSTTISSDATLKSLDVSGYTLSPKFNSKTNYYNMQVNNNITGLNVEAVANDSNAQVKITGNSGWTVGVNNINITVTAEDGTTNVYIVSVTRAGTQNIPSNKSNDNFLSGLTLNNGLSFNEPFSKYQSNYSITVPYDVSSLDLKAVTNSSKAKIEVIGNKNFEVGKNNVVQVIVTAEDGGVRYYTINVTRSNLKSNNNLSNLSVNGHTLNFDKNKLQYDLTVDSKTDSLDIIATPENAKANVVITGNDNLATGKNVVLIKVTDELGFTKVYQINVTKEAAASVLGMDLWRYLLLIGLLLSLLAIIFILLFKKKDKKEDKAPVIEFKPEFNFGSKNTNDNDTVESGGVLNQNSNLASQPKVVDSPKVQEVVPDASYTEVSKQIPYDPYDDIVTKDELYDAIMQKDTEKLKMLMEQEALNRRKQEMKRQEGVEEEWEKIDF